MTDDGDWSSWRAPEAICCASREVVGSAMSVRCVRETRREALDDVVVMTRFKGVKNRTDVRER